MNLHTHEEPSVIAQKLSCLSHSQPVRAAYIVCPWQNKEQSVALERSETHNCSRCRFSTLTSLEIREGLLRTDELPVRATALQKLELWRMTISLGVLQVLWPSLPRLTQLYIQDCDVDESDLDEQLRPVDTLRQVKQLTSIC